MAGASYFSNFDLAAGILNIANLRAQQKELVSRVVLTVEGEVKKVTPVRTGHLRRSVTGQVVSVTRGVVGSNLTYAPVVHRRNPYLDIGYANAESKIDAELKHFASELV